MIYDDNGKIIKKFVYLFDLLRSLNIVGLFHTGYSGHFKTENKTLTIFDNTKKKHSMWVAHSEEYQIVVALFVNIVQKIKRICWYLHWWAFSKL